jgi:hypothetical protein
MMGGGRGRLAGRADLFMDPKNGPSMWGSKAVEAGSGRVWPPLGIFPETVRFGSAGAACETFFMKRCLGDIHEKIESATFGPSSPPDA